MIKKVLLVGSSFSAAPIFFSLKKRGLHVSVCGSDATDPCHQYADASHFIDYSDRESLLALVSSEDFDYLVPSCNDYSYMASAWVAEQFGFPGFDAFKVATVLHTKNVFRELTTKHSLPAPCSLQIDLSRAATLINLPYPLLIKPVDSFSGRGVTKLFQQDGLHDAICRAADASRTGEVVIEEFVDGELFSHSAFISNGRVAIDFFVNEYCTVYPYQVNCSHHPSSLGAGFQEKVRESIQRMVTILGLKDGLLHTQFIANANGQFWIIECMRRCPGDLYGGLIEMSLGINYTDLFVRPFVGENIPRSISMDAPRLVGRHTVSTQAATSVYSFSHRVPNADVRIIPLKSSGELIKEAPYDKLAILFAEFKTSMAMLELVPKFSDFIDIQNLEELYVKCEPYKNIG
jgi:formate-dependent phosphoribosylglycinamide formyltransferase (GAR transformylase)